MTMSYLYGDSTPSPLRSNFLEFLRDAIDFGVFVLLADERIRHGKRDITKLERAANEEISRLEALGELAANAIGQAPFGAGDSPTARCATELRRLIDGTVQHGIAGVRAKLGADIAEVNAREAAEREGCLKALEKLLLPHDPWDAITDRTVVLHGDAMEMKYHGHTTGVAGCGWGWTLELGVQEGHALSQPMRIDRIVPEFVVAVPDMSGWLKKEVKIKPQHLENHYLTEVFVDADDVKMKLRIEPNSDMGFDLEVLASSPRVRMLRTGAKDAQIAGRFEVRAEDEATIVAFAEKVRAVTGELARVRLVEATHDDAPFKDHPKLREIVERLVGDMAPIVCDIAERSLSPNELVIKRLLGDDRREEIFVSKAALREKLSALPTDLKSVFDKLQLAPALPQHSVVSQPLVSASTPIAVPAAIVDTVAAQATHTAPTPAPEPEPEPELEVVPALAPTPVHAKVPIPPLPPSQTVMRAEAPSLNFTAKNGNANGNGEGSSPAVNLELVAAIKNIVQLAKKGKSDDAYRAYSELFESESFKEQPPEHQRQTLRLMVLSKSPPAVNEHVRDAHRAAATRLRGLIEKHEHPADYEMLGVCQLLLEDTSAASATFSAALEIERKRDPSSELCGNLMRRVASL